MSNGIGDVLQNSANLLGSQDYNGLCLKFVDQVTGSGNTGPSAIESWNRAGDNRVQGTGGIEVGDPLYFSPNDGNGNYGHVGVYIGNGQFRSATNSGVKDLNVSDWLKQTGQQVLGYIPLGGHPAGNTQPYVNNMQESAPSQPQVNSSWLPSVNSTDDPGAVTKYIADSGDMNKQLTDLREATLASITHPPATQVDPKTAQQLLDQTTTFTNTMAKQTAWGDVSNMQGMNIAETDGQNMSNYAASEAMPFAANPWAQKTAQIGYKTLSGMLGPDLAAKITPIFVKQIHQESGFNPDVIYGRVNSSAGAQGIAQIMPNFHPDVNPLDPEAALTYAATMMGNSFTNYGGNVAKALAAYNGGAGTVNAAVEQGGQGWMSYLPDETKGYLQSILGISGF